MGFLVVSLFSCASADTPPIDAAGRLIDRYFAATGTTERRSIVTQLEQSGLSPAALGRLTHIRLSWPTLQPGVYYVNEKAGPFSAKYFLGVPRGYRPTVAWPLVVKLPTANAFLGDRPPSADQIASIYTQWINDELNAHPDALVLMPLLNLTELYGPSYQGVNSVIQPILNVAGKANVDPARVYMIGHAMAAHAVWNIALHYPTYFAAINPLGGGASAEWQQMRVIDLRNVLPVVWADADDPIAPLSQTRQLVDAMRRLNLDVEYDQTNHAGHLPPADLIEADYQKMRARVRELYPTHVSLQSDRPDAMYNRADWIQEYEELNPGKDEPIYLERGAGVIHINQNAYGLDAILDHNTVRVSSNNVELFRLYFNEQMIDFSKPVTVIVNNLVRFRGMVTQNIEEMLKDQLFLGRGWRYYTAVLDIDLTAPPVRATSAPTSRPHGHITVYNEDGTIQRVIETPGG